MTESGFEPFERWRAAQTALQRAESAAAEPAEISRLAAAVIAARIALTETRMSDGWTPPADALDQLARDALLLTEGEGAIGTLGDVAALPDGEQP